MGETGKNMLNDCLLIAPKKLVNYQVRGKNAWKWEGLCVDGPEQFDAAAKYWASNHMMLA
jgi:hypothetical protein